MSQVWETLTYVLLSPELIHLSLIPNKKILCQLSLIRLKLFSNYRLSLNTLTGPHQQAQHRRNRKRRERQKRRITVSGVNRRKRASVTFLISPWVEHLLKMTRDLWSTSPAVS